LCRYAAYCACAGGNNKLKLTEVVLVVLVLVVLRFRPLTTEGNEPTPILIRGVERRIFVKTDRNPGAGEQRLYSMLLPWPCHSDLLSKTQHNTLPDGARCSFSTGRPYGLYGGAFAAASEAAIRNASVVLKPPTISNILALEAPPGGHGAYRYGTLISMKPCVRGDDSSKNLPNSLPQMKSSSSSARPSAGTGPLLLNLAVRPKKKDSNLRLPS
jgi:hypothetical protein